MNPTCLNYAKGSAGEPRTQIYIGIDIGYVEREQGIKQAEEISRMLHGLMLANTEDLKLET
ncbi:MAG TPA: four helix bundle protein [Thiobacillaceae bacterium]|nr:four helix bundle protein [Thiobacillaceae bacterium]